MDLDRTARAGVDRMTLSSLAEKCALSRVRGVLQKKFIMPPRYCLELRSINILITSAKVCNNRQSVGIQNIGDEVDHENQSPCEPDLPPRGFPGWSERLWNHPGAHVHPWIGFAAHRPGGRCPPHCLSPLEQEHHHRDPRRPALLHRTHSRYRLLHPSHATVI